MGVFDKLLSAVRLNDDLDDDLFDDDELMDDFDDDSFFDKESKPKSSLFSKLKNKKSDDFDDLDDFDDYEDDTPARKPEKKVEKKKKVEKESRVKSSEPKMSFGAKEEKTPKFSNKVTPMRAAKRGSGNTNAEVCLLQPKSMEDTRFIADALLDNSIVILSLEGIDVDLAQRISDFSAGVCYSLGGDHKTISAYIFVLVPYNVELSGEFQNYLNSTAPSLRAGY